MATSGPTIETDRLLLRPPVADDLDGFAAMMADERSARFVGGVMDRNMTWRVLAAMAGSWALHGFGMFSVIEKASGRWIGRLGPWRPEEWPGAEIGWGLRVEAWGQGFATEGAAATMDWAFDTLGWDTVIHGIDPANEPSKAVARRLGSAFLRMGEFPGPLAGKPIEIWGQNREEWKRRGGASPAYPLGGAGASC